MAVVTTVYCDCCGAAFQVNRVKPNYDVRRIIYSGLDNCNRHFHDLDLCDTCLTAIDNAIEDIFNPPVNNETVEGESENET